MLANTNISMQFCFLVQKGFDVTWYTKLSVTANINWIVSTWPNKRFLSHGMLPLSGHDDVALFKWRR